MGHREEYEEFTAENAGGAATKAAPLEGHSVAQPGSATTNQTNHTNEKEEEGSYVYRSPLNVPPGEFAP